MHDARAPRRGNWWGAISLLLLAALLTAGSCDTQTTNDPGPGPTQPQHDKRYGIYVFDPGTGVVELLYSSDESIHRIHENDAGTKIVFRQDFGDDVFSDSEICLINPDGSGYERLTENTTMESYPYWSPDGTQILFLAWPNYPVGTMNIFVMDADGSAPAELYDSGFHDGDCCWVGDKIVFTRESQIWIMNDDGTGATQVTDYALAGQQGDADLPFGDYDPRLSPAGTLICFDRRVDDQVPSGTYDFFTIAPDGSGESAITTTGHSQFIAEWSHAGDQLVFLLAAVAGAGVYDLYTMNPDGSGVTNITPADWPATFLCTHPIYSHDDSKIYFVGQWWE